MYRVIFPFHSSPFIASTLVFYRLTHEWGLGPHSPGIGGVETFPNNRETSTHKQGVGAVHNTNWTIIDNRFQVSGWRDAMVLFDEARKLMNEMMKVTIFQPSEKHRMLKDESKTFLDPNLVMDARHRIFHEDLAISSAKSSALAEAERYTFEHYIWFIKV